MPQGAIKPVQTTSGQNPHQSHRGGHAAQNEPGGPLAVAFR